MNHGNTETLENYTSARGTELPPPFSKLFVYIFIFKTSSLFFHLSFLNLTCSCAYSYNLMQGLQEKFCKAKQDCFKMGPRGF